MKLQVSLLLLMVAFVNGSKDAYATVTSLRLEKNDRTEVFLLAAKSGVAPPLGGATVPKMEHLADVMEE
ncbi:hypothetical protein TNCV_1769701 [Trichonephila clavipes]|nr:hypothetical protein TNCV_1769701 [Trichonephila clavipes]